MCECVRVCTNDHCRAYKHTHTNKALLMPRTASYWYVAVCTAQAVAMPETPEIVSEKMGFALQAIYAQLPEGVLTTFAALTTDAERAEFVWQLPAVHATLTVEADFSGKSEQEARKYRDEGNVYFRKKSYLSATRSYTLSIASAPCGAGASAADDGADVAVTPCEAGADVAVTPGEMGSCVTTADDGVSAAATTEADTPTAAADDGVSASERGGSATESESTLALAYANRSASLLHMRRYRLCLADIELALACVYPPRIAHKLYERRAVCHAALGERAAALASVATAREALSSAGVTGKTARAWGDRLDKLAAACEGAAPAIREQEEEEEGAPPLGDDPNAVYQNASLAVEVIHNEATGQRHLAATRDLSTGEVLMVERPYAVVLFREFYPTHCYACLRRVMAPVPCESCSAVLYCSPACRQAAWAGYHRVECRYMAVLDPAWCGRIAHLAVRIVLQEGVASLLTSRRRHAHQFDADGRYAADQYAAVRCLATNAQARAPEGLFDLAVIAALLSLLLTATDVMRDVTAADQSEVRAALLQHLQALQCNAVPVVELQLPTHVAEPQPRDVGVGVYPTVALIDHSCDPNSDLISYGCVAVLRAACEVRLLISWCSLHGKMKSAMYVGCLCVCLSVYLSV